MARQEFPIVWLPAAAEDLKEIHDYIGSQSQAYAGAMIDRIVARPLLSPTHWPFSFSRVFSGVFLGVLGALGGRIFFSPTDHYRCRAKYHINAVTESPSRISFFSSIDQTSLASNQAARSTSLVSVMGPTSRAAWPMQT